MKEAPLNHTTHSQKRETRQGTNNQSSKRVHERGDKVVVNGAKESLLAILRKYICKCTKHNLEKLTLRFLNQNKITASYNILVWMFIFIRQNCQSKIYSTILSEYLVKMKRKRDQDESHESQKYIAKKKQTIQKFIESAQILLTDSIDLRVLQKSVEALYSKGKSKENSVDKINKYLSEKTNFDHYLQFEDSSCSFMDEIMNSVPEMIQSNLFQISSEISEDKISQASQYRQILEVDNMRWGQAQANMSERKEKEQSYDLFDSLIQNEESVISLFSPFYF